MTFTWKQAFNKGPVKYGDDAVPMKGSIHIASLEGLRTYLDRVHIKHCLLRPYFEEEDYPLINSRELLPSFEMDLYEYKKLPGFSLVALDRPLDYFQEVFQFDILHSPLDQRSSGLSGACPLESTVRRHNLTTIRSRLAESAGDRFEEHFKDECICFLDYYQDMMEYLLEMDRAQVLAKDSSGEFHLAGVYASLPSDLDTEIKRFGMKIGKFRSGDNVLYERNRGFVYQYLMELYGFPIASERRTSAALFARRLHRMGERFLVKVIGQSDRTITTLYSHPKAQHYPRLEKVTLISVNKEHKEAIAYLRENGYFVDKKNRVVILRVIYKQHKFNPENVREDRALSILRQEVVHPLTGESTAQFNLIKDAGSMVLRLNDIVRGEYQDTILYKRVEIVHDTETHENRLKFLYTWLSKHQRRIIGYSDEFYNKTVKVLDSYLLSPDNYEHFKEVNSLYQEVWARYSYIQQARKVRILEDHQDRNYKGETISYLEMLESMTDILGELRFEVVNYFDQFVKAVLTIGDKVLSDSYLRQTYIEKKDEDLTDYGRNIKMLANKLVGQLDEFRAIRKSRMDQGDVQPLRSVM